MTPEQISQIERVERILAIPFAAIILGLFVCYLALTELATLPIKDPAKRERIRQRLSFGA